MIIRKGMWVVAGEQVGIVTDINVSATVGGVVAHGLVRVVLVDEAGCDRITVETDANGNPKMVSDHRLLSLDKLRQARLEEIPEPRRPDAEAAGKFGYA